MAFKYGRADIRAAAFDRPRLVEPERIDRTRELERDHERREREERRHPRSRTRSPPRRFERRRSPEKERLREFERERRSPVRERRSPMRDRERRDRDRLERPVDRMVRERDGFRDRDPRRASPFGDRLDRMRDVERLPPGSAYGGFSGPPAAGFSVRSTGFSSRPPYGGSGVPLPAAVPTCYVCGGLGHFGRDCPSNPQEVSKLRSAPRRDVGMGDPVPLGRGRGLPADDSEIPKCYECGKRGHVARECRLKQGETGPIEQRCYNCGSIGHIARECTSRPTDSRPPPRGMDVMPSGPPLRGAGPPLRGGPDAAAGGEVCYQCGRPGHFARECPTKFGPPSLGPSPMDRWLGGMPGPGPGPRGMGFSGMGLGMGGFGGMGPGGRPPPGTEGCYDCGQLGHFARECPMRSRRMADRAAAAAGAGGGAGGEGRRIASKASTGGRAEEAKLNYELEDYMKERASHRRDGGNRSENEEDGDEGRKLEEGEEAMGGAYEEGGGEDVGAGEGGPGEGGPGGEGEEGRGEDAAGAGEEAEDVRGEEVPETVGSGAEEVGGEEGRAEDERGAGEEGGTVEEEEEGGEGGEEEGAMVVDVEGEGTMLPNLNEVAPDNEFADATEDTANYEDDARDDEEGALPDEVDLEGEVPENKEEPMLEEPIQGEPGQDGDQEDELNVDV